MRFERRFGWRRQRLEDLGSGTQRRGNRRSWPTGWQITAGATTVMSWRIAAPKFSFPGEGCGSLFYSPRRRRVSNASPNVLLRQSRIARGRLNVDVPQHSSLHLTAGSSQSSACRQDEVARYDDCGRTLYANDFGCAVTSVSLSFAGRSDIPSFIE